MLKWIFATVILFNASSIFSQALDFKWGEVAPKAGDYFADNVQFVGETDNGYYYFAEAKRNFSTSAFFVYGFNKDLTAKGKTQVEFPKSNFGKTSFMNVYSAGKRGVMFFYASSDSEIEVIATEVVENGNEVTFKHKTVYKGIGSGYPTVSASEDASKFVVAWNNKAEKGAEDKARKVSFLVIDNSFNVLWKTVQEPKNNLSGSWFNRDLDIAVSKNGDVILVYDQKDPAFKKNRPEENADRVHFTTAFLVLTEAGTKANIYTPSFGSNYMWNTKVTFHNNEIYCAGKAYDRKNAEVYYSGFLTFKMDLQGVVSNDKITRVGEIEEFVKLKPEGNIAFNDISIEHVNGKFYVKYESMRGTVGTTSSMFTYEGAILQMLDENFKVEWTQYISKYQATTNTMGALSSFIVLYNPANATTVVAYNAFGKDKNVEKDYREENGFTYQILIDANGKMTKKPIFDGQGEDKLISPKNLVQTQDGNFIVLCERKVNFMLAKLELK